MSCIVPTIQNTVIIPFIILRLSTSLLLLLLFLLRTFRTCLVSWWFQGRHAAAAAGRIGMAAEKRTSHPFTTQLYLLLFSLPLSLSHFLSFHPLVFYLSLSLFFFFFSLPLSARHFLLSPSRHLLIVSTIMVMIVFDI